MVESNPERNTNINEPINLHGDTTMDGAAIALASQLANYIEGGDDDLMIQYGETAQFVEGDDTGGWESSNTAVGSVTFDTEFGGTANDVVAFMYSTDLGTRALIQIATLDTEGFDWDHANYTTTDANPVVFWLAIGPAP